MNKFLTLFILMLMFLLEELYYWLPVTTTAKLANKAHFGNWHISNQVRDELNVYRISSKITAKIIFSL